MQIRHVLTIVVLHLIMLSNASFTAETIIGAVNYASIETALKDEIVQILLKTSKVWFETIVTNEGTTVVIMVVASTIGHATK